MSSIWEVGCSCLNITDFDWEYYSMSGFYNIHVRAFTAGEGRAKRLYKYPEIL